MALGRAHASANVQQSRLTLIQSIPIQNQTDSRVTVISQNATVMWGVTFLPPNPNLILT